MRSVVYETFHVDNMKCRGCATTIEQEVGRLYSVDFVKADPDRGTVRVMFTNPYGDTRDQVLSKLKQLGYPQEGTSTKLDAAKSMVSCALGRLSGYAPDPASEPTH